mgnify:CR=1 FL=1
MSLTMLEVEYVVYSLTPPGNEGRALARCTKQDWVAWVHQVAEGKRKDMFNTALVAEGLTEKQANQFVDLAKEQR